MIKSKLFANNISKSYGKKTVLSNVHINICQEEIIGFLGPNGSGKTTLFYIIAGLVKCNSGQLFLDKVNISDLPMYKRAKLGISYLPQDTSIFRGLTAEENILSILQLHEHSKAIIKFKLEQLLEEFNITHIRKQPSLALSGGEKRRVEIARAIAGNPKFILLDEPFAGIDPIAVIDIKQIIIGLKNKGVGVLITDHNVRETLEIVDKAYILYNGNILIKGTKEDVITNKIVKEVYLGNTFY